MTKVSAKVASKGARKAVKAVDTGSQHDAHVHVNPFAGTPVLPVQPHEVLLALPAPTPVSDDLVSVLEGEVFAPSETLPAIIEGALEGVAENVSQDDDASHESSVSAYLASLMKAFSERKAYQFAKDATNETIQGKLDAMSKALNYDRVAEVMMLAGCDANRINRAESKAARYNVYAYEKDINIARTIASVEGLNHYTLAIFKTMLNLHREGLTMTQEDAYAAVKLSHKAAPEKRPFIVKYDRCDVATGTMTTQASSSINALQSFDVLRETGKRSVFTLNVESAATQALIDAVSPRVAA